MFCVNCGEKLEEGVLFCPKCGKKIDGDNKEVVNLGQNKVNLGQNKKVEGKGSSIASMVLGIIGLFFAVSLFFTSGVLSKTFDMVGDLEFHDDYYDVHYDFDEYYDDYQDLADYTLKTSFIISSIMFVLPLGITGLCLGVSSKKKISNGFNKAGVILNALTLGVFVINFIWIMFV